MIYLASPYSHANPQVVATRVQQTRMCFVNLLAAQRHVFSPILLCHEASILYELPGDAAYWQAMNEDFLSRMDEMYVLTLPGWQESKGIKMEIDFAEARLIPITYINVKGQDIGVPQDEDY